MWLAEWEIAKAGQHEKNRKTLSSYFSLNSYNKDNIEFSDVDTLQKTGWTFKGALRMYPALSVIPR
jgi:hypothetical protein